MRRLEDVRCVYSPSWRTYSAVTLRVWSQAARPSTLEPVSTIGGIATGTSVHMCENTTRCITGSSPTVRLCVTYCDYRRTRDVARISSGCSRGDGREVSAARARSPCFTWGSMRARGRTGRGRLPGRRTRRPSHATAIALYLTPLERAQPAPVHQSARARGSLEIPRAWQIRKRPQHGHN